MNWQDRMAIDPKVLVGKPVIRGTRIAVEFVIELVANGWTPDQILQEYDHLTPEDIQSCLADASEVSKFERVYLTTLESRTDWAGSFTVVTNDRIRMRPLPSGTSAP